MSWSEAYDEQLALWRFWKSGPLARAYAHGYAGSVADYDHQVDPEASSNVSAIANMILAQEQVMFTAEPVYVEKDMLTLVEHAYQSFEIEPLVEADILVQNAFVYFPRAVHFTDVNGKDFPIRALAWAPVLIEGTDPATQEPGKNLPGLILSAYLHYADDNTPVEALPNMREFLNYTPLTLVHITPWAFGRDWMLDQKEAGGANLDVQRFTQALMRLMSQNITMRVKERPARPSIKRAKKFKFGQQGENYVTVIQLRRPKTVYGKDHEVQPVAWTHRWLVSGFWRNQYYASESIHRRIWINPFVKGPEELPLIVRQMRAFEFSR